MPQPVIWPSLKALIDFWFVLGCLCPVLSPLGDWGSLVSQSGPLMGCGVSSPSLSLLYKMPPAQDGHENVRQNLAQARWYVHNGSPMPSADLEAWQPQDSTGSNPGREKNVSSGLSQALGPRQLVPRLLATPSTPAGWKKLGLEEETSPEWRKGGGKTPVRLQQGHGRVWRSGAQAMDQEHTSSTYQGLCGLV